MRGRISSLMLAAVMAVATIQPVHAGEQLAASGWQPKGDINFLVASRPGGGTDLLARALAKYMPSHFGGKVSIVNKPGGGGIEAGETILRSDVDHNTIATAFLPGWAYQAAVGGLPFAFKDFAWVTRIRSAPWVMLVSGKSPYKTIEDVQNAKEPVRFGSHGWGYGTPEVTVSLAETLGIPNRLVIYKGTSDMLTALVRGDTEASMLSVTPSLKWLEEGSIRAIMYTGREREERIPDVPTLRDLKLADEAKIADTLDFSVLVMMHKDAPAEVVQFYAELFKKTLEDPDFTAWARERQVIYDTQSAWMSPDDTNQLITDALAIAERMKQHIPQ